jgi:hypothetical protein
MEAFAKGVGKVLNYRLLGLYEFMVLPGQKTKWLFPYVGIQILVTKLKLLRPLLEALTTSPVTIENPPDRDFGTGSEQAANRQRTSSQQGLCFLTWE